MVEVTTEPSLDKNIPESNLNGQEQSQQNSALDSDAAEYTRRITCTHCQTEIDTQARHCTCLRYLGAGLVCILGMLCCICCPSCMDYCLGLTTKCPNCNKDVHTSENQCF